MIEQLKQHLILPQLAVGGLETAFNALIKRSSHVLPILRKLAGKSLQINLTQPNLTLFIIFSEQRTDWLGQYEGQVDCQVNLSATALPKLADRSRLSELINDQILVLKGDLQVLQQFATLLDELEKDPTELLSPLVGDVVVQGATDVARVFINKVYSQFNQNAHHLVENLMTERPVLVHRLQIVDFCDQVRELEKQADELAQKVAKYQPNNRLF